MRLLQQEWPTLAAANEVLAADERQPGGMPGRAARPDPWQARHSEQALTHTLLYEDAESYAPLARIEHVLSGEVTAAQFQYFHTDLNGAPEELTDIDGQLLWQVRYRAWGNTVMEEWGNSSTTSAAGSPAASPAPVTSEQNLRFQGQYLDRQTGLHYNTFRYYDPDTGRFLCQDPIGLAGGINLYQYAPNAIDWVDPWGLTTCQLSAADKRKMGPAPPGMKDPHRHHIIREMAPKNWSKAERGAIYHAQNLGKKFGIDVNKSLKNFTWAQNGGGAHTKQAAAHVRDVLAAAAKKGAAAFDDALADLGKQMTRGEFF